MAKGCSVLRIGTIINYVIVKKAKIVLDANEFTVVPENMIVWTAKLHPMIGFNI
jgi:hypothetical protein